MAAINLRRDKERPLTIEEVDNNFDAINREVGTKLDTESFNAENILSVLDGNAGLGSGLDADLVRGKTPTTQAVPDTSVLRDSLGNIYANQFYGLHIGDVLGDVQGVVTGALIGNSTNVDGVVQVDHGGTGATTPSAARTNLGLGSISTQNKNTVDITGGSITGITDLAIADGGTGASTKEGARSNLGLVIGQDIQAYAAILGGISATVGDGLVVRTATNTSVIRKFVEGNSIEITNETGKDGDITIGLTLVPTVTAITKGGTNASGDIGQADNRFGGAHLTSVGVGIGASGTAGEVRATNNITAFYSSDASLKENIQDVQNPLDIVCAIGSKTFDWTDEYIKEHGGEDGYFVTKSDFGVVAQDVLKVFPQAVRKRENGTLAVDYEKLATLSFGAVKELKFQLDMIKKHIGMEE